jgi:UDP-GlcNAc:undecaprenyl-phosphate GlcNAc-1-phosphate transferase
MTSTLVLVGTTAFAAAAALTPVAISVASRTGFVDRPGELKPQAAPVPLLGGVAVFLGCLAGAAAGRPTVVYPLAGALALGAADDRGDLSPALRLVGECAVGVGLAAVVPVRVPAPAGDLLVVLGTVTLINGVNFVDGLDGLASAVVAICAGGIAWILGGAGRYLGLALGAALVGFLLYNRPRARVYLGDGGSYVLGTALACLVAMSWGPGVATPKGVAASCAVAIFVCEVAFAVVRRFRAHRPVTAGDRRHPYDLLASRGWSQWAVAISYASVEALVMAAAAAASARSSTPATLVVMGSAVCFITLLAGLCGALSPELRVSA